MSDWTGNCGSALRVKDSNFNCLATNGDLCFSAGTDIRDISLINSSLIFKKINTRLDLACLERVFATIDSATTFSPSTRISRSDEVSPI